VKTLLLAAARHIGGSIKAFDGHPQRVRRHVAAGYVNRTVKAAAVRIANRADTSR
jgi:hypothetical protein